jgi:hypothetical protein
MSLKKKNRCIEIVINHETLKDIVAAHVHAMRAVYDSESISDIEFGGLNNDLIPLKVHFKPANEIQFIKH